VSPALITAVVSALLALGSGIAWLVKRRDAAKDPIPKQAAELALAEQALGIIRESRDALREDVQRLKEEREEHRSRLDAQQEQINSLRDAMDQVKHLLSHATRYIETLLRWARDGAPPPPPSVPRDLIDLIDPALHEPVGDA
jgi:chromosome segregation ATPase